MRGDTYEQRRESKTRTLTRKAQRQIKAGTR